MKSTLNVTIMSGVEDGTTMEYRSSHGDGQRSSDRWIITIGRRDENDICLRNDTYVSRRHATITWYEGNWWLEDLDSTNGTFVESEADYFTDAPVKGSIFIREGQLFRVGRTWLRIHTVD